MTDDDVRRWAAEWVGRFPSLRPDGSIKVAHHEHNAKCGAWLSDADLAEAVRVKALNIYETDKPPYKQPKLQQMWNWCLQNWGHQGPLTFLRAVQEIVDE